MSTLIVEVVKIDELKLHPYGERLEIAVVKGWETVVKKGDFKVGDKVIYIPVDTIVPTFWAEKWGVKTYLAGKQNDRVKAAKLRQIPSYGFLVPLEDPTWEVGRDCVADFSLLKYNPPIKITMGDAAKDNGLVDKYTDIENVRNFPDIFVAGELVSITEKIHGSNSRLSLFINSDNEKEWAAGSHRVMRKKPETEEELARSIYWYPYSLKTVRKMVESVMALKCAKVVTIYGEVFGRIQSLHYGRRDRLDYAAFDIMVDGKYLDFAEFIDYCKRFEVPHVPILEIMPFNWDKVKELSGGDSVLAALNGDKHIREGVVVKPLRERVDAKIGRVILKYISDDYLLSKHKDEDTTDV